MPGRKRTPTELRKLRGNPSKRPLPKHEPKPRIEAPSIPPGLSAEGKREWKRITGECVRLKLITALDHSLMLSYISEWEIVRKLKAIVQKKGVYCLDKKIDPYGYWHEIIRRAPWDTSLSDHEKILARVRADLGFTPTARTKAATVDEEEPKKAQLLAFDGGKK